MHNCPFQFWTMRFMGPLDSNRPWCSALAAPPLVGSAFSRIKRFNSGMYKKLAHKCESREDDAAESKVVDNVFKPTVHNWCS